MGATPLTFDEYLTVLRRKKNIMKKILFVCLCSIFIVGCEVGKPPPPPPSLNENAVWYTKETTKRRILSSILNATNDVSDTIKQRTYGLYDVVDIEDINFVSKQNIINAERQFKDKKFITSGKVYDIGKGIFGPYLIVYSERSPANVLGAQFETKDKDGLSYVRKGQRITLACEKAEFSPPRADCEMFDDLIARKGGAVDALVNSILNGKSSWDETFDLQTKRVYSIASKMPSDSVCFISPDAPECRKDYKRAQAIYEKETGDKDGSADSKETVSGESESQNEDKNGKKSGAEIRANICAHFIAENIHKMAMTQFGYEAKSFSVSQKDIYPEAPNIWYEVKGAKLKDKYGKWHDVKFQCFVNRETNEIFNDVMLTLSEKQGNELKRERELFLTDEQLQEEKRQQKLIYMVNPVFAKPETSWAFAHRDDVHPVETAPATDGSDNQQAKACYKQVIKHLTPSPKAQKQWVVISESMNETEATFVAQRRGHTINVGWSKGMGSNALQTCSVRETNADGVEVFNDEGSDFASTSSPVFFKQK